MVKETDILALALVALLVPAGVYFVYDYYTDPGPPKKITNSLRQPAPPDDLRQIRSNLHLFASAGFSCMMESGQTRITYPELAGEFFTPFASVDGERYDELVYHEGGGVLRVWGDTVGEVTFEYKPGDPL